MSRKFLEKRLIIASHNEGKIKEISALFAPFGIEATSAKALNLLEPEESGNTYLENALIKARACTDATGLAALSDDSGVEVKALFGQPGVHTAPYTKEHGGLKNVFSLWEQNPKIRKDPRASFISVQVLLWPDGHYEYFEGVIEGRLTFPPRGTGGHGYDPIFIPDGHEKTVAEMSMMEKNTCSHRSIAFNKLMTGVL